MKRQSEHAKIMMVNHVLPIGTVGERTEKLMIPIRPVATTHHVVTGVLSMYSR